MLLLMSNILPLIFLYKFLSISIYIYIQTLAVLSPMEEASQLYHASWHYTEINSHIGIETVNVIVFFCTRVMHCIKYVRSYLHESDMETNKVFS